jgi:hypothetical protein
MNLTRRWLEPFNWDFVTAQNEILCRQKSTHHGPTSDGHEEAKELSWLFQISSFQFNLCNLGNLWFISSISESVLPHAEALDTG